MAQQVAAGIQEAGANPEIIAAAEFSASLVGSFDAIAFGCPAMGAEELESDEFAPLFEACLPLLRGKPIALFGSYGWGDGSGCGVGKTPGTQGGAMLSAASVFARKRLMKRPSLPVRLWVGPWPSPDRDAPADPLWHCQVLPAGGAGGQNPGGSDQPGPPEDDGPAQLWHAAVCGAW